MADLKVAYILTPITYGGAEKVSFNFLKSVDRRRFNITPLLLLRPWEEPPLFAQEIEKLGYDYITLPVSLKQDYDPLRVARVSFQLFKILKAGKFDLIHTHGYFADICAIPVARLLRIKVVTTCHGFIVNKRKLKLYNKLDTYFIKGSSQVIAVSEGIKHQLIATGISPHKIIVIPNAVETEFNANEIMNWRSCLRRELQIRDEEFVVGFLGRLNIEKGVNFLIEAVGDLVEACLKIRLLIVGDGDERENLEIQVANRGIVQWVTFAGFQKDTQRWLSAFDLFVLPSLTEGTPMALLEAMALGVPVVASKVGGVPNIIENTNNGLLCEPADMNELKKCVLLMYEENQLRNKIASNGKNLIKEEYGINQWIKKIESVYIKECLGELYDPA